MIIKTKTKIPTASSDRAEWSNTKCDKYDYMSAVFCGGVAGLIDLLFVDAPKTGMFGKLSDSAADKMVMKFAKLCGWSPKTGKENSIASAIGFLERHYQVNYDQRSSVEVGGLFNLTTKNHHYKSLSHCPDPVGLFFSILDQFIGTSSFLSGGKLIRVDASNKESPLRGNNFISKLFSGFCNWLGHIMSDFAGSSGSRIGGRGRGTGVTIPFMELFQLCNFGQFQVGKDRQSFDIVMIRVFQEGYDARHGGAMSIPVILEELFVRAIWVIRQRYQRKKDWRECIPSAKHADVRVMLLTANTALCLIDGAGAMLKGGGNAVAVILHMNYVAWVRLTLLVFRELKMQFGAVVHSALESVQQTILYDIKTPRERKELQRYYASVTAFDKSQQQLLQQFIVQIEQEHRQQCGLIEQTFSKNHPASSQAGHSVELARSCNADKFKIIRDLKDLDGLFR